MSTPEPEGPAPSGRLIAAIAGGAVAFFIGIIPLLGPIGGGVVSGYLRGSDTKEGVLTGGLAGLIASIPGALLAFLFLVLGGVGALIEGNGEAALGLIVWIAVFLVAIVYMIVFCGLGGAIGAAISNRRAPT